MKWVGMLLYSAVHSMVLKVWINQRGLCSDSIHWDTRDHHKNVHAPSHFSNQLQEFFLQNHPPTSGSNWKHDN